MFFLLMLAGLYLYMMVMALLWGNRKGALALLVLPFLGYLFFGPR